MNQCPPGPQVFHWGRFEFFSKIRGDIRKWIFDTSEKLFSGVNDTGEKLFTSVNDIAKKLFGGVNDTSD